MRLRILSDLHLEFGPLTLSAGDEDLVVLAGDIDNGARAVGWAAETFRVPVIYVAGNHEFYGHRFSEVVPALRRAAHGSGVCVLEDEAVVRCGVRFIGATLWTDLALYGDPAGAAVAVEATLADYRLIHAFGTASEAAAPLPLRAADTAARFARSRAALVAALEQPFPGKTVVVTHHLPSPRSIAPRWRDDPVNCGFASNLEDVMARFQPALWIHGHTHDSFDYLVEHGGGRSTRVVCNPAGYPSRAGRENPRFRPDLVVEV